MCDRERGWSAVLEPKVWRVTAFSAVLGLALAAGVSAVAGPWDSGQRKAERHRAAAREGTGGADHGRDGRPPSGPRPAPSAPGVLAALGAPGAPPAGLGAALAPLLRAPGLGTVRAAAVHDAVTGERLYGVGETVPVTPASTTKIATSVAALAALGPDHRIATTVAATPDGGRITLVGGGDPTLDEARLTALADATARAVRAAAKPGAKPGAGSGAKPGATSVALTYDTSRYTGTEQHPIGPNNENLAPVTALMTNEGRLDDSTSGTADRSQRPAAATARTFASLLASRGLPVADPVPGRAPAAAKTVARTHSAPLSALVERTLTNSDNDIAEALARQTAIALGEPASFEGASRALKAQLTKLGLPLSGAHFADGSGLDRNDKVTARLLAALLAKAADPARPELRSVLTGLPVAGFTGTLSDRYSPTSPGTGLVRAKTGTLRGVNTLAGTAVLPTGRLVTFAFLTTGTSSAEAAQPALDALANRLATTG
ncbi:D-alanyl-D-alanine carboxypeptidase/D-alanyl-D-alanine-endopeptidase [Streptomyces sp. NPDC050504]|uniref:D-alanyl-D-alanine carboxypeptidase/D-alanyl-D-alanine endopeptidase n=1 Tax=Streptomyces sp. NPDC050504 TaxID=3365618 RepID=UPI0037A16D76